MTIMTMDSVPGVGITDSPAYNTALEFVKASRKAEEAEWSGRSVASAAVAVTGTIGLAAVSALGLATATPIAVGFVVTAVTSLLLRDTDRAKYLTADQQAYVMCAKDWHTSYREAKKICSKYDSDDIENRGTVAEHIELNMRTDRGEGVFQGYCRIPGSSPEDRFRAADFFKAYFGIR